MNGKGEEESYTLTARDYTYRNKTQCALADGGFKLWLNSANDGVYNFEAGNTLYEDGIRTVRIQIAE